MECGVALINETWARPKGAFLFGHGGETQTGIDRRLA